MRNILITGGTGLIGFSAVRLLLQKGVRVYSIVREPMRVTVEHKNLIQIPIDLNSFSWTSDLPQDIDIVCHLAQSRHFREFPGRAKDVFNVNVRTVQMLLDFATISGARKFVLGSSGAVYAKSIEPLGEDSALQSVENSNYYTGTKLCAELLASCYRSLFDVVVLRYFFVYGDGQNEQMLFPRLIQAIKQQEPIKLSGRDGMRFNPTYVEDAAAATVAACIEFEGSCNFNVAGNSIHTMRDACEILGEHIGRRPMFEAGGDGESSFVAENSRMRAFLFPTPATFADGASRTLQP